MLPGQGLAAGHVLPRWSFPLQPGARGGGAVLPLSTAPSCSPGSPFRSAVCAPFSLFQPLAQAQAQGCLTQRCLRRLSESTWGETGRYEVQLLRPQEPPPPPRSPLPYRPPRPGHGCTCSCLSARPPVCQRQVHGWAGGPTGSRLAGPHGVSYGLSREDTLRSQGAGPEPLPHSGWRGDGRPGCLVARIQLRWRRAGEWRNLPATWN